MSPIFARNLVPDVGRLVLPGGLAVEVATVGQGPDLVLLHGYADSWRSFDPLLPLLADHFRLHVPTLRGHGGSDRAESYRIADFTADAIAAIETLAPGRRVHLLGHSLGSIVAQRVAAVRPDLVDRLVLIGTAATARGHEVLTELLVDLTALNDTPDADYIEAFQRGTTHRPLSDGLLDTLVAESGRLDPAAWTDALRGLVDEPGEAVAAVTGPVLILWGEEDGVFDRDAQKELRALLPQAAFSALPGIGHAPHWEDPAVVAGLLREFLGAVAPSSGGTIVSRDSLGHAVTASSGTVAAYDRALSDYLAWKGDPVATLAEAVEADPGFALGHSAIASLLLLNGARGDAPAVTERIAAAAALDGGATPRERAHLAAARAFAEGRIVRATDIWEDILLDHPRDALALRFAHDSYFYLGHSNSIRDSIARVLPEWDQSHPLYGFILGQYAFGLEEAGNLAEAEAAGHAALARNRNDAWAVHAVAHVLETQSRQQDGIAFLTATRPDWSGAPWLAVHNGWHLALYLIEEGRGNEVLADYDRYIAPRLEVDSLLDLVDASALLWRLELAGIDVGARWQAIARQWLTHVDDHVLVFNDLHIALAVARAGRQDGVERLRASLDRYASDGPAVADNRAITADVGRDIVEAVLAYAAGDYARTVNLLLPIRYKWVRIGGSHAQRDLLTQTLIAAAERAKRWSLVRALLDERAAWRPTALTLNHQAAVRRRFAA